MFRRYHIAAASKSFLYCRTSAALTPMAWAIRSKSFCEYVGTGLSISEIISPRRQDSLSAAADKEEKRGGTVLIASGDRDTFQLASDRTTILYPVRAGENSRPLSASSMSRALKAFAPIECAAP